MNRNDATPTVQAWMAATALAALLGGCAGIPVHSDYDASIGVAHCRTFAWPMPSTQTGAFGNPLNLKRLRTAVSAELTTRGMTEVPDAAQADCLASVSIGTRNAVEDEPGGPWGPSWGFGWGWGRWGPGPWGPGWGWGFDEQYIYRQGGVSVNLFDAKTHEPIWHATAQRDVTGLTGAEARSAIEESVRALFAKFPTPSAAPAATPNHE